MESLTKYELNFRLQALYNIIDEGLSVGIQFKNLEEAVAAYCTPDFIEPSEFGCENFKEVTELLLNKYPYLYEYPNC
jgi:hypothetical protein